MSIYSGRGIYPEHFRKYIIEPTLETLGVSTPAFVELMMMTVAHESLGSRILQQVNGRAVSPFQIEPNTHDDLWLNYFPYNKRMMWKVKRMMADPARPDVEECRWNLRYACAIAALVYHRSKYPMPSDPNDTKALATYYKIVYNTYMGSAKIDQVIDDYKRWV